MVGLCNHILKYSSWWEFWIDKINDPCLPTSLPCIAFPFIGQEREGTISIFLSTFCNSLTSFLPFSYSPDRVCRSLSLLPECSRCTCHNSILSSWSVTNVGHSRSLLVSPLLGQPEWMPFHLPAVSFLYLLAATLVIVSGNQKVTQLEIQVRWTGRT